ncbi:hypothetical protein [Burkholderia guangdongensis]|uniref:hypothetical protein n=1 Tax=Burkholderia guangdongensis TaxID=1792500 RepID=UPI003CCD4153
MRAAVVGMLLGCAMAGYAEAQSQPLILDTQQGIRDGKGGLLLQTAPLSHEPIVEPAHPRTPAGQASNTSMPIYIVPTIKIPGSNATSSGQSQSPPQPRQP